MFAPRRRRIYLLCWVCKVGNTSTAYLSRSAAGKCMRSISCCICASCIGRLASRRNQWLFHGKNLIENVMMIPHKRCSMTALENPQRRHPLSHKPYMAFQPPSHCKTPVHTIPSHTLLPKFPPITPAPEHLTPAPQTLQRLPSYALAPHWSFRPSPSRAYVFP
jgi:hypothetical protein